jgi:hypothetical protein
LSSPMRIHYDEDGSSDDEAVAKLSRFSGIKNLLNQRRTARKVASAQSLNSRFLGSSSTRSISASFVNRSRVFETQSTSNVDQIPSIELTRPEASSPTPTTPYRDHTKRRAKTISDTQSTPENDACSLSSRNRGSTRDWNQFPPSHPISAPKETRQPSIVIPQRKRSRYVAEPTSAPKQNSTIRESRNPSENRSKRTIKATPAAEAAVLQWIDSVDSPPDPRRCETTARRTEPEVSSVKVCCARMD